MKLTKLENEVVHILFLYRGLRAKDVAALRYNTNDITIANEKSTYNLLKRLQEKGMVMRLKNAVSDHSIYYLSVKALEFVKYELNIQYGANGNGYLPLKSDTTLWDIPYKIYSPPRYQWGHYLMVIDCIKTLLPLYGEIRLQLAYYCNLDYEHNYKTFKVKPDLMIKTAKKSFAVEVDTGTESMKQLIDKFRKYKLYCEYCSINAEEQKVDTILLVVPNASETNLNRRWVTILEAFYTAFDEQLKTPLNLIFVPMNKVEGAVRFEMQKCSFENEYKNQIKDHLLQLGYTNAFWYQATLETNETRVYLNDNTKTFKSTYVLLNHARETSFFRDKHSLRVTQDRLKDVPLPMDKHNGYKYEDVTRVFLCLDSQPAIPIGLSKSSLSKLFVNKLVIFPELCDKFKKIENLEV